MLEANLVDDLTNRRETHARAQGFPSDRAARDDRMRPSLPRGELRDDLSAARPRLREGQAIREAIYYELAERRDQYTTSIQDIAETDRLIQKAGVTDSAAALLPAGELCRMLGVDAVMRGSVTKYKKHGAGGQIVTAVLFGFAKGSDVKADVAIYDGGDGQLIYEHNIEKAGGLFSSPDALRNSVGKTVAKAFPYKKQG